MAGKNVGLEMGFVFFLFIRKKNEAARCIFDGALIRDYLASVDQR